MMQWVKFVAMSVVVTGVSIFIIKRVGFLNTLVFGA